MKMSLTIKNITACFFDDLKDGWEKPMFLIIPVLFIFAYLNYHFLDISFLSLHSLDEYMFHGSLLNLFEGAKTANPILFFRTGFYSYGFIFFLLNFFLSLPALIVNSTELAIFIPRMSSSIFAVMSLFYLFKMSQKYLGSAQSYFYVALILLMPGFWKNGIIFHPDWLMTCGIIISAYFLLMGEENENFYWLSVFFLGLSITCKIQAITFTPILFVFIFKENILHLNFFGFVSNLKKFFKTLLIFLVIFIFTNPYILHPVGRSAFISAFLDNLESNQTNHGANNVVSIGDKICLAINEYYLTTALLLLCVIFATYLIYRFFKYHEKTVWGALAICFLVNIGYLLFFVNKNWQHYYLPVVMVGILLLLPLISILKNKWRYYILIFLVVLQFLFHFTSLLKLFDFEYSADFTRQKEISDFLVEKISGNVVAGDYLLMSPSLSFEYKKLGLNYNNIVLIMGQFSQEMFDEEAYKQYLAMRYGGGVDVNYRPLAPKKIIILDKQRYRFVSENLTSGTEYSLVNDLLAGKYNYKILDENDFVYIFIRE